MYLGIRAVVTPRRHPEVEIHEYQLVDNQLLWCPHRQTASNKWVEMESEPSVAKDKFWDFVKLYVDHGHRVEIFSDLVEKLQD